MDEKFCPFISTKEEKNKCNSECEFWDNKQKCCEFKKETTITISEGIVIACGFTIWGSLIGMILYTIFNFII